jgi:hypothetical protein
MTGIALFEKKEEITSFQTRKNKRRRQMALIGGFGSWA